MGAQGGRQDNSRGLLGSKASHYTLPSLWAPGSLLASLQALRRAVAWRPWRGWAGPDGRGHTAEFMGCGRQG